MLKETEPPLLFDSRVALTSVLFRENDYTETVAERFGLVIPDTMRCAVRKRRAEYVAGRTCARRSIQRLNGIPNWSGHTLPNGQPQWPSGMVGTITHTAGYAAAAVALEDDHTSIGMDTQYIMKDSVQDEIGPNVCDPRKWLPVQGLMSLCEFTTLMFSAKEAAAKCLYPLVGRMFWMRDIQIDVAKPTAGLFQATLLVDLNDELTTGTRLLGSYILARPFIHTGLSVALASLKARKLRST